MNTPQQEIMALILARGGSTGVPGKNIKPLAGKPLIGHTIEIAQASKHISRTVVATDSPDIANVARQFGADVPFNRLAEHSGVIDRAYDVYRYFIDQLKKLEDYRPDIMVFLFGTSYSKTVDEVDAAIHKLIETRCDWVFTVTEADHHPYRMFTPQGEGDRMVNFCTDVKSFDIWGNRQELPPTYRINGNAFVTWTENIENHTTYNVDQVDFTDADIRYVLCPQETSMDIDTSLDFDFAEFMMTRPGTSKPD
ncbi:MAG: acylneuraminate cytidylyltransferase family protein [Rhodospirillales bacterium]|jgi:CMP-N-acetylneuraminic acid synthetase|nr:acylneuraminate cytidylyltransferase family protein [Rhodospirillales bacterium]